MVLSLIEGGGGDEFLAKLHSSTIFEIQFPGRGDQFATILRFPKFLACQFSTRFRQAENQSPVCALSLDWVFGSARRVLLFEKLLNYGMTIKSATLLDLFKAFIKWLYTGKLYFSEDGYRFYDFMRLADVLGAPKLHDEALRNLSGDTPWHEDIYDPIDFFGCGAIREAWNRIDFSKSLRRPPGQEPDDGYWADKKLLLFSLDFASWAFGLRHKKVERLLSKGGELAVLLGYRMKLDDGNHYPSAPEVIGRYVADKTLPEYQPNLLPANDPNAASQMAPFQHAGSGGSNLRSSNAISGSSNVRDADIIPDELTYIKQEFDSDR